MQHHLNFFQCPIESCSILESKRPVLKSMFCRKLGDPCLTSACKYRFHPAFHCVACDQLARISIRAVDEKCFFHYLEQLQIRILGFYEFIQKLKAVNFLCAECFQMR